MNITDKIYLRARFKKEHPDKKVLAGNATDFKRDYVEWLERQVKSTQ